MSDIETKQLVQNNKNCKIKLYFHLIDNWEKGKVYLCLEGGREGGREVRRGGREGAKVDEK